MISTSLLHTLTVVSAWLLLSARIQCCNHALLNNCIMQFSLPDADGNFNCDISAFDDCLNSASFMSCTDLTDHQLSSIQNIRELLASPMCADSTTSGNESPCLDKIYACKREVAKTTLQFVGINGDRSNVSGSDIFCLCENPETWGQQFDTCIERSGYSDDDCSSENRADLDKIIDEYRNTSLIALLCNFFTDNVHSSCSCATRVEECVDTHLNGDFYQVGYDKTYSYPECLEYGTPSQLKAAADCLQELPASCGLATEDFTGYLVPFPLPYGYDIMLLRFSCLEACQEPNVNFSSSCFDDILEESRTPSEIQALEGEEKDQFCGEVETALMCYQDRLSGCPAWLFYINALIADWRAKNQTLSDIQESDETIRTITILDLCDVDFLEGTEWSSNPKGAAVSNTPLPTIVTMALSLLVFRFTDVKFQF